MNFPKMSDLSPISKSEQAGLDSLRSTFPHAVIRHCAVERAAGVHHLVSVETAEFYVAGSGELLNEALAEVFGSLGDIELFGEMGAYVGVTGRNGATRRVVMRRLMMANRLMSARHGAGRLQRRRT